MNPYVALCVGTYEIEGTAIAQGHPLAEKNAFFAQAYQEKHPGSFEAYSTMEDEIVVHIAVHRVRQWRYIEGKPFLAESELIERREERQTNMDIVKKSGELLGNCTEIMLSSLNENGYPRTCVLSKTKSEGIKKVWCSTGLSGTKTRHFYENPKAGVCFWKDGNSVTLVGEVAVRTDREIREEMWQDWFIEHFTGGIDDPNYCVLEFSTTEEATLWIDGQFVTLKANAL